ncbi:alpha/beta-hydrolase [Xylariomycetidae sp. FL0641]|nr:alpha/beta-hydrolase [Xylariomycetidae sp. FL0641]
MATSQSPTLILVHGLWHVPKNYTKLTNALRALGFEVHVPRLPSMNGSRPPNADLTTDTDFIRCYVESLVEAGRSVAAIGHSYGGSVITNALCGLGLRARSEKGLAGGVAKLIYMSAFAQLEGKCMNDKVEEFGHGHLMPLAFDFADDNSCVCRDPKTVLLGEGADPAEEEEAYLASLVRCNGQVMYQAVERCAWREIPVAFILTASDVTVPVDYQKSMVQLVEAERGEKVQTVELATGHCSNLTKTKELVDAIKSMVPK